MAIFLLERKGRHRLFHSIGQYYMEEIYIVKLIFFIWIPSNKKRQIRPIVIFSFVQYNCKQDHQLMSSLKDKLKSKIKSRIQQPETMQSFDQNSVNVTISQGKSQLSQIKLQCLWNNKNNMKNPRLKCRWYNRTQNNLQEIVGIEDEIYQPSILDVGSIIEITCEPQLPGIIYEGMPFQLKSSPILLALQTENEATNLINSGKAKFFIQLKEAKIKGRNIGYGCDSMIKIEGYRLVLCQMKFGQLNDDIIKETNIDELFPQLIINRKVSRQLLIKFNEEENCVINFKNHQVRDVFCLYNKLMIAKINFSKKIEEVVEINATSNIYETPTKPKQMQNCQPQLQKIQRKISEQNNVQKQEQKIEVGSPKQIPKTVQTIVKASAADLLQLSNLKQEIKQLQIQNSKLAKQLESERQKNYSLQNKISQINERMQNLNRNYFQLQKQLKLAQQELSNVKKSAQQKINKQNGRDQELLYYRNQIKIMSSQKLKIVQTNNQLTKQNQALLEEVKNYRQIYNAAQQHKSFRELQDQMNNLKQMNNQLKLKYEYSIEQKDKIEEDLKNSRNLLQQIEAEKKYIQKKYESLTNQLSSPTLSLSKISDNKSNGQSSLSNSYVFEQIPCLDKKQSSKSSFVAEIDYREKQILQLKKQLKDLIEENGYIRALLAKQKKPSSKSHLKLQLFQVKKLVNKLSEALVEKDMCINNLKQINKQLNKKNSDLMNSSIIARNSV